MAEPAIDLPPLIEDLEAEIDDLETTLSPLLSTPLTTTLSTLPLLDKAKLHILVAYAIESLLYAALQASGANAKEHAIFAEIARLRTYFGKVKNAESADDRPDRPKTRVDKDAAARFIRHGLAGNDRFDLERKERLAKEK
ncbi:Sas10/Utp3/C1D family-domain-containing protein, partial [Massariosphaeria phaeospora]